MKAHPKINPPKIVLCPHCGNNTVHVCRHREDFVEAIDETIEGEPIWDDCWWAILKCTTCGKLSLYKDEWDEEQKKWGSSLVYPISPSAPKEVPIKIRETFDESISVFQRAPSLAAVGIRKCLEGISDDQNAQGRTLAQRINSLSSNEVIPKTLTDMMDISRVLGNVGAHFGESTITADEVKSLIEFTLAIFEYIYVAPAKVEKVRKSVEETKGRFVGKDNQVKMRISAIKSLTHHFSRPLTAEAELSRQILYEQREEKITQSHLKSLGYKDVVFGSTPWLCPQLGDAEIKPENYAIGYGFVTDYLAEIFTRLRRKNYQTIVNANVEFGRMTGRNQDAIKKTSAGLLKLIFPHRNPETIGKDDLGMSFDLAIESRQRIIDQLAISAPSELKGIELKKFLKIK